MFTVAELKEVARARWRSNPSIEKRPRGSGSRLGELKQGRCSARVVAQIGRA
jgi:hypothetical protein